MKHQEWKTLTQESQLEEIIQSSFSKPIGIFKHSTSCGISAMILDGLKSDWSSFSSEIEIYYLDLLAFRSVSTAISSKFAIQHQSPQLILIHQGKVIYAASHHAISLQKAVKAISK